MAVEKLSVQSCEELVRWLSGALLPPCEDLEKE